MSSRFQHSSSRNALFSNYDPSTSTRSRPTPNSSSPLPTSNTPPSRTYSSSPYAPSQENGGAFSAYPGTNAGGGAGGGMGGGDVGSFRSATPNKKGEYSASVMDELESQNDEQVGEMSKKVRMLKDISLQIGTEIRDSTALAEKMNDGFEATRNRLRGTMNRMLRMAERTGIGWRVWVGFFVFIIVLFAWVRVF